MVDNKQSNIYKQLQYTPPNRSSHGTVELKAVAFNAGSISTKTYRVRHKKQPLRKLTYLVNGVI